MATTRVKSISSILKEVKDSHRFLKVSFKDGAYSTSRVQINGHKTIWAKDSEVVYSPATGLAGRPDVVDDFLRSRADRSDDSAEDVRKEFKSDRGLITFKNQDKHRDYMESKALERERAVVDCAGTVKMSLVPREQIPDLLARAREARGQVSTTSKSSRADVIGEYLKKIEETGKVYRVHGCTADGRTADGKHLRSTARDGLSSKSTIPLASTKPLDHFYIPTAYDNRRYVVNFMTLYYMHADNEKLSEAQTRARNFAEELLAPYKKVRGAKAAGDASPSKRARSSSAPRKSRSASPAGSAKPRKSRSASPKLDADGCPVTPKPKATPKPRASRSASPADSDAKPRKSRASSVASSAAGACPVETPKRARSVSKPRASSPAKGTDSTVFSAGSSRAARAASPSRSPSPASTSPKAATSKAKVFRLPSKKD